MGIGRDSRHKHYKTGGRSKVWLVDVNGESDSYCHKSTDVIATKIHDDCNEDSEWFVMIILITHVVTTMSASLVTDN